jgi:hypothetical protein
LFKTKAFLVVTVITMIMTVFALACAPTAAPKPASPAATPPSASPVTTPATTPAATVEGKESWDTYTGSQPDFSIKCPKGWVKKDLAVNEVLSLASTANTGADALRVFVAPETQDFAGLASSMIDETAAFKQFSVKSKVESDKATTLADGKTPAHEVVLSGKIMSYTISLYCVMANSGGKTVAACAYTLKSDDKVKDLMQEIARTLTVK